MEARMGVKVKRPTEFGNDLDVPIDGNFTVENVKNRIFERTGIIPAHQLLLMPGYEANEISPMLDGAARMVDLHQWDKNRTMTVWLYRKNMYPIPNRYLGVSVNSHRRNKKPKPITVQLVEPNTTVGQLKTLIDKEEGVPPNRQELGLRFTDGTYMRLWNMEWRLMDVTPGSEAAASVFVTKRKRQNIFQVTVRAIESPYEAYLGMEEGDTVYTLQSKMRKSPIGSIIGRRRYTLHIGRHPDKVFLDDGAATLASLRIRPNGITIINIRFVR